MAAFPSSPGPLPAQEARHTRPETPLLFFPVLYTSQSVESKPGSQDSSQNGSQASAQVKNASPRSTGQGAEDKRYYRQQIDHEGKSKQ